MIKIKLIIHHSCLTLLLFLLISEYDLILYQFKINLCNVNWNYLKISAIKKFRPSELLVEGCAWGEIWFIFWRGFWIGNVVGMKFDSSIGIINGRVWFFAKWLMDAIRWVNFWIGRWPGKFIFLGDGMTEVGFEIWLFICFYVWVSLIFTQIKNITCNLNWNYLES